MNCPACNSFQLHVLATQAAIRAGHPEKTAASIGYENLTKPQIAEDIQVAMNARNERTRVTADRVVEELAKVGVRPPYRPSRVGPWILDPAHLS
jgi:phage terminase small subunit